MFVDHIESLDDLESYSENTQSALCYLMIEAQFGIPISNAIVSSGKAESKTALNSSDVEKMSFIGSHLGVCSGIVTTLRGFSYHASHVRLNILSTIIFCNNHVLLFIRYILFRRTIVMYLRNY